MIVHPTAIIFDYGNVLCTPQLAADIDAMASVLRLPAARFSELAWRFRLAYDAADLDAVRYWNTVAEAASRSLTPAEIDRLVALDNASWTHPNPAMLDWARRLREAGIRTAILSNMPSPVREYLDGCAWLPEFDHRTFSCDVRRTKPNREIYQHCLAGLGVEPSEALFLDDRDENIRAAQELGIHALLFTTLEQAAADMDGRFSLPVPLRA